MKAPQRDSREPLLLHFDEPLDVGMLQHSLQVLAVGKDVALPGEILANNEGLSWRFTPDQPWKPGQYLVAVNPRLEDRAGNSLAQPFEREIPEGETEPAALPEPKTTLRFEIAETPRDKPNVVVILADDLGLSRSQLYGQHVLRVTQHRSDLQRRHTVHSGLRGLPGLQSLARGRS